MNREPGFYWVKEAFAPLEWQVGKCLYDTETDRGCAWAMPYCEESYYDSDFTVIGPKIEPPTEPLPPRPTPPSAVLMQEGGCSLW